MSNAIFATARLREKVDDVYLASSWAVGSVLDDTPLPEFVHDRAQDLLLTPGQPRLAYLVAMDFVPWEIHAIVDRAAYTAALHAYALENAATHS